MKPAVISVRLCAPTAASSLIASLLDEFRGADIEATMQATRKATGPATPPSAARRTNGRAGGRSVASVRAGPGGAGTSDVVAIAPPPLLVGRGSWGPELDRVCGAGSVGRS